MKKGMTGPKQVQNPARPIHQILKLKNNPLWFGEAASTWIRRVTPFMWQSVRAWVGGHPDL